MFPNYCCILETLHQRAFTYHAFLFYTGEGLIKDRKSRKRHKITIGFLLSSRTAFPIIYTAVAIKTIGILASEAEEVQIQHLSSIAG
jgi:hypothetical protein